MASLLVLSLLLSQSQLSASAPVAGTGGGEINGGDTTGWRGDPNGRGTMTLLISCLATLSLCVYSSIHLNVPRYGERKVKYWLRFGRWLLTGIFAPELVVFTAWRQYSSARVLQQKIVGNLKSVAIREEEARKKKRGEDQTADTGKDAEDIREPAKLEYTWTMMHGFYAGMGGFIIDLNTSRLSSSFVPNKHSRLTLTARGVSLLYECGLLPEVQKRDIKDKSKADSLAKTLVCLQAAWMCIQVLGRMLSHLPVTLLEVNTLGHVFCAIVVYVLWWHKPQLINEPTKLDGDWVECLCAFMYMSSKASGQIAKDFGMLKDDWKEPELARLRYVDSSERAEVQLEDQLPIEITIIPDVPGSGVMDSIEQVSTQTTEIINCSGTKQHFSTSNSNTNAVNFNRSFSDATTIAFSQSSCRFVKVPLKEPDSVHTSPSNARSFAICSLNDMQINRWKLAAEAIRRFPAVRERFERTNECSEDGFPLYKHKGEKPEELVHSVAGNWPGEDLLRETQGLMMGSILWCASMVFGALHLAAWADHFPTDAERWLWRASAIWITFSGGLWMLINLIAFFWKATDDYWSRVLMFKVSRWHLVGFGIVCTCCGVAYILARIFLVVEAFVSIRKLPVTAYSTPEWSQIIPHI